MLQASSKRRLTYEKLEQRCLLAVSGIGSEFLINESVPGDQRIVADAEAIAMFDDGRFVAAYAGRGPTDRDGVYVRQFLEDGTAGTALLVNTTIAGEQTKPSIASFRDESFVVAWAGRGIGDRHGVYAQWFTASGDRIGSETLINSTVGGWQTDPHVTMTSTGQTIITWHGTGDGDTSGIFVRSFGANQSPLPVNESPLGPEMLVNSTIIDEQASPSIAADSAGGFLISWHSRHQDGSDWGVFAQRYDAAMTRDGPEFQVNQTAIGSQQNSSIAVTEADQFLIGWSDRSGPTDDFDINARRFTTAGEAVGPEFQVNETSDGNQVDVSISSVPGDGVLAAWSDGVPDGSGWEVKAREFDDSDSPAGSQIQVNQDSSGLNSGHQRFPAVAVNPSGQAVIAWTGNGITDHDGVHAQLITASEPNLPPLITPVNSGDLAPVMVGNQFELTVTATDPNPLDQLTFLLDRDDSPANAVLEQINNNTAIIRWRPSDTDLPGPTPFRVLVTDDGIPPLPDSEDFVVQLATSGTSFSNLLDDLAVALGEGTETQDDFDGPSNVFSVAVVNEVMALIGSE